MSIRFSTSLYQLPECLTRRLPLRCRCPALAQVSSRQERFSDYALAHLITQQGPEDKVLVAQLAGQLVGCMAVTSMVDVSPLQQNFDLQVYDQLVLPEVYEAALAAHEQRLASTIAGKLQQPLHELRCDIDSQECT